MSDIGSLLLECKGSKGVGGVGFARGVAAIALTTCVLMQAAPAASRLPPVIATDLRTQGMFNPLSLDDPAPKLSWIPTGSGRSRKQSAYRIIAASTAAALDEDHGDLWDSGKVAKTDTFGIAYGGNPLLSRQEVFWKVQIWDENNVASPWSKPATFHMGLLFRSDWTAHWIDRSVGSTEKNSDGLILPPSPYFRRAFVVNGRIKRAILYSTALGLLEVRLNGAKVGKDWFSPGWTDYNKRVHYSSYDVTSNVHSGENVLGAILADGWYAGYVGYALFLNLERSREFWGSRPHLLSQLEIEYEDGRREVIGTDSAWKVSGGPIQEADLLMGETYDARAEPTGWDLPGFDDKLWASARDTTTERSVRPSPKLEAYPTSPTRVRAELKPVTVKEPKPGMFVFDVGKNVAGVVRLKVTGPAGTRVKLRFGEMLNDDGTIMTANLRRARATDTYILKGDPRGEVWEPHFTYHGFQFVEVTGFPGVPNRDAVTALQLTADLPETGSLEVAGDVPIGRGKGLITQLIENIQTTQMANFIEIPTDCPQRDERLGWAADIQVYARSAAYFRDAQSFLAKWTQDMADAQIPSSGAYPVYAPTPYAKDETSPAWGDAGVIVPYELWRTYADRDLLERQWSSMNRFMAYQIEAAGSANLRPGEGMNFADWLNLDQPTSNDFIATAYFGYDAAIMAEMAQALGLEADMKRYQILAGRARRAFAARYLLPDGSLTEKTQTAYALSLAFDLLPKQSRSSAAERLVALIHSSGDRLTTGFLGTKYVLPILTEFGHNDLAYKLLIRTENPSWGYSIVNGATSVWERWNSYTRGKGFYAPSMNSFSHYAFGAVAEWMFSSMGGIQVASPGFGSVVIAPAIDGAPFQGVTSRYRSVRGEFLSAWKRAGKDFVLSVKVPVNTTAEVRLPALNAQSVREAGRPVSASLGVRLLDFSQGIARYQLSSGNYEFRSIQPPLTWGGLPAARNSFSRAQARAEKQRPAERVVYSTARNRWNEGSHRRPDKPHGTAYLNAAHGDSGARSSK